MSRSHTHIFYLLIGLCFSVNIQGQILDRHLSDLYADKFNQQDKEIYIQSISNKQAKDFLAENIPFFECPDKDIEEIYYFRWWTYRKHIKETPEGFIITEFLPDVSWAGKYNGICCPAWFHFREGRWLHEQRYLNDYAYYWLRGGGDVRSYSFPIANAIYQYFLVTGNDSILKESYPELVSNFNGWEKEKFNSETGKQTTVTAWKFLSEEMAIGLPLTHIWQQKQILFLGSLRKRMILKVPIFTRKQRLSVTKCLIYYGTNRLLL